MAAIWKHGLAVAALLASTITAQAAVTDWSRSEGGRMRLAALAEGADGKITAILQIDPEPGWKTYWRDPGDAGVPPAIDLAGTENLTLERIRYPVPEIGQDEGGRFNGYHQPVSLILDLRRPDPKASSVLDAQVLVGLCKDICLPFQASFRLQIDDATQPVADEFMAIQMAAAELPEAPSPGFRIVRSGLSPDGKAFEVIMEVPGTTLPDVAVAASAGLRLGKSALVMSGGSLATLTYPIRSKPESAGNASITLLVKSAGRAMETVLAVR